MLKQVEPPKLRDLVSRALQLGYEPPELDFGDGTAESGLTVPMVRVQLHSNSRGLRNVVAHCQIPPDGPRGVVDVASRHRLAVRSALAEALDLADTQLA